MLTELALAAAIGAAVPALIAAIGAAISWRRNSRELSKASLNAESEAFASNAAAQARGRQIGQAILELQQAGILIHLEDRPQVTLEASAAGEASAWSDPDEFAALLDYLEDGLRRKESPRFSGPVAAAPTRPVEAAAPTRPVEAAAPTRPVDPDSEDVEPGDGPFAILFEEDRPRPEDLE